MTIKSGTSLPVSAGQWRQFIQADGKSSGRGRAALTSFTLSPVQQGLGFTTSSRYLLGAFLIKTELEGRLLVHTQVAKESL